MKQKITLKESQLKRMIYETIKKAIKEESVFDIRRSRHNDNDSSWENKREVDLRNKMHTMPYGYGTDKDWDDYDFDERYPINVGYDARQIPLTGDEESKDLDVHALDYDAFINDYSKDAKDGEYADFVYRNTKNESRLRRIVDESIRMALK